LAICTSCLFGIGVWTQGLHLKPLHQSFFMMGFFFELELSCLGWLQTSILLKSASWVARITEVSH
jgi:hypothetical protein